MIINEYTVLVGLYEEPERPSNAVDYIKRYMGAPAGVDVEALRVEVEQLRADKAVLEQTVRDLNAKVMRSSASLCCCSNKLPVILTRHAVTMLHRRDLTSEGVY